MLRWTIAMEMAGAALIRFALVMDVTVSRGPLAKLGVARRFCRRGSARDTRAICVRWSNHCPESQRDGDDEP